VGLRYAQALFDLSLEAKALDAVEADLGSLKAALDESADLSRLIASPAFSAEDKAKGLVAVAEALKVSKISSNFIGLLTVKDRAAALPAVIAAFKALAAAHRGTVSAEVVTAAPLTAAQLKGVTASLKKALGKDPEISTRVDPSILGGLKVRVGSRLFDASLKSKLDSLKFALKRA
jgi:F-type H+-transporting ATPase subunit delta